MVNNNNGHAVIIGGGDFPTHPIPLQLLHEASKIICCDGAAFTALRHGIKPWRIIGDCDSILTPKDEEESNMLENHRSIIRKITSQDDNDQTKAVKYCLDHGLSDIIIIGATGRREDHTLGNISLLIEYLRMGVHVTMYTDYGYFLPCKDSLTLDVTIPEGFEAVDDRIATRQKSTQISIFNVSARHLRSEGLRYPLYDFDQWWQGTLNEAISSPIHISGKGEFLVYVTYE